MSLAFGGVERFLSFLTIALNRVALKNYFADFRKCRCAMHLELKYFPVNTPQDSRDR